MGRSRFGVGSNQYKKRPGRGRLAKPSPSAGEIDLGKPHLAHADDASHSLAIDWDTKVPWDDVVPRGTERALVRYHHRMADFVYDASYLEGNPHTLPEIQTLLDGITVGGKKLSDQQQILSLRDSFQLLQTMVADASFAVSKESSDRLNYEVIKFEALEPGHFRGEGTVGGGGTVNLGEGRTYHAAPTEPGGSNLRAIFDDGWAAIQLRCDHPVEQGAAYFALAAHGQFYFDGNKRTGRLMMNGHLMMHGYEAISVPAAKALAFNESLRSLYADSDATALMELLYGIYRESEGF